MMDKLAARVVWSIKATRSTVEQARKIYCHCQHCSPYLLYCVCVRARVCVYRDNSPLGNIIGLLVEYMLGAFILTLINDLGGCFLRSRSHLLVFIARHFPAYNSILLERSNKAF